MITVVLLLVLAPVLFWGLWFQQANRYKRSQIWLLVLLFFAGMASGSVALIMNHTVEKYTLFWSGATEPWSLDGSHGHFSPYRFAFWGMVGFNEEFAKLLAMLLVVYRSKDFQDYFDGILYAAIAALGFATVENLLYLSRYGEITLATRSVITLPAHVFMSIPMGYYLAKSRLLLTTNIQHRYILPLGVFWILLGWAISAIFHAFYDILLTIGLEQWAYAHIGFMAALTTLLGYSALKNSRYQPKIAE